MDHRPPLIERLVQSLLSHRSRMDLIGNVRTVEPLGLPFMSPFLSVRTDKTLFKLLIGALFHMNRISYFSLIN